MWANDSFDEGIKVTWSKKYRQVMQRIKQDGILYMLQEAIEGEDKLFNDYNGKYNGKLKVKKDPIPRAV